MQRSELVGAYLATLDLQDRDPDPGFLNDLVGRHVATFAFSSVGCRLGDDLPLDLASLFDRIVVRRRGGYCFEQNGLLFEVLEELGLSPELYLARVIYNQDTHPGLTHRISVIRFEGRRHVVDVGFGADGPRRPVLLSEDETNDGDMVYRVAERRPGEFHMQVLKDGEFFSLYRFELSPYGQADCEVGHFYSHRHPAASFVNHLVVSRLLSGETRSLRDLEYRVRRGQVITRQVIGTADILEQVLVEELGVQVTAAEAGRLFGDLET